MAVHPPGARVAVTRRVPTPAPAVLFVFRRMPRSPTRAGCVIEAPGQECSQSTAPSDGATAVAPASLSMTTCSTPSITTWWGEL